MFEITKIKIRNNLVSDECELLFRQYYYWLASEFAIQMAKERLVWVLSALIRSRNVR